MLKQAIMVAAALAGFAIAARAADPGVTDQEILLGQTMAYSGPASAYGNFGKVETAYLQMVNDKGGVNGRKIRLISLDDGYSPPRTIEQARKLVEQEKVFFMFAPLGTPGNVVIRKYLNEKHVPQVFATSGLATFGDYAHFPWTIGWQPSYEIEGQIFVKYILDHKPDAKIAILYQNDDLGKDYVRGVERELGDRRGMIVGKESYELTDATIDSQIVALKATGADTFIDVSSPKFAAQAIRRVYDLNWKPLHLLSYISASVAAVMQPAGVEKGIGIISSTYFKDPTDPRWANDADFLEWSAFIDKYLPGADKADIFNVVGYMMANSLVQLLAQCGNDMSRENVMRQAAHLDHIRSPMLLPGITLNTSPTDFYPLKSVQLERFDGKSFNLFGEPMTGAPSPR